MESHRAQWSLFISHSLANRLSSSTFALYAEQLSVQASLPSIQICDLLLRPLQTTGDVPPLDGRVPGYAIELVRLRKVEIGDILRSLYRYSKWRHIHVLQSPEKLDGSPWQLSWIGEEAVMLALAKACMSGETAKSLPSVVHMLRAVNEWIVLLSDLDLDAGQDMAGKMTQTMLSQRTSELSAVRVALGTLVGSLANSRTVSDVLHRGCPKDLIQKLSKALSTFAPTLLGASQPIAQRLEVFRTQVLVPLDPLSKKTEAATDEMNELLDSAMPLAATSMPVPDLPILNARASLYVYLSSLLVARPAIHDEAVVTFLNNRYQGNAQVAIIDLVGAAFDILANAIFRKDSAATTLVLRSFLINKIPLLLVRISTSMFASFDAEFCITQALSNVDTHVFPTLSSMFDGGSSSDNVFGDSVRQDFCFSCCLHGLIAEDSIERLLGEIPMQTLPAGGRYLKDDLIQKCLADPGRLNNLLNEVELMDGNVGAVCSTITEMISQLCQSKDTMLLKTVCVNLARKPSSFDTILLFERVSTVLKPLCDLLNGWHHDEELGEYQPVYEEFGGILLLVMAFVYRYSLSAADLGIDNCDSFVSKWLIRGSKSRSVEELSASENNHLDVWIRALFNTDGGGLSDQPMSSCPPQDFYLLVPTLFQQIVLASSAQHLTDESLKGGLEFLVDTLLLPSLIGAIIWLSDHLWESHDNNNTVLTILHTLILPAQISTEAGPMLASILAVVAVPLERSLRYLQSVEPSRQDIEPLSKALSPYSDFPRTGASKHTELEAWTRTPEGGLSVAIRNTLQQLIQWSLTPGVNATPVSYTHRLALAGLRMLGARRFVNVIVDELRQQTQAGSGSMALDVGVAIICSSDTTLHTSSSSMIDETASIPRPTSHRMTLHEALKAEADSVPVSIKTDVARAETIVRLLRRVEAQLMTPNMMQTQNSMLNNTGMLNDLATSSLHPSLSAQGGLGMSSDDRNNSLHGVLGSVSGGTGEMLSMGDGLLMVDDDDLLNMDF